jgi:hypothetical protein
MSGVIPPLPQYAFMAWCSVKAQGQLYLYLYMNVNTVKSTKNRTCIKWKCAFIRKFLCSLNTIKNNVKLNGNVKVEAERKNKNLTEHSVL